MAKITEYAESTQILDNDVMLISNADNGTRKVSKSTLASSILAGLTYDDIDKAIKSNPSNPGIAINSYSSINVDLNNPDVVKITVSCNSDKTPMITPGTISTGVGRQLIFTLNMSSLYWRLAYAIYNSDGTWNGTTLLDSDMVAKIK